MIKNAKQFVSIVTEAANRAEATALLIRCGYRVYRPEADIHGEDLLVRLPESSQYKGVQLKAGIHVDEKYLGHDLLLLLPSQKFEPGINRRWFMPPHDELFTWIKMKHGRTPKWKERWVDTRDLTEPLIKALTPFELKPLSLPHDDRFLATEEGTTFTDADGAPIDFSRRR